MRSDNSEASKHRVDRRTTLKKLGVAGFGGLAALGSASQAAASHIEGDERVAAQATADLPGDDFLWTDTHRVDSGGREYYSTVLGYRGSVLEKRTVDFEEVDRWAHSFEEGGLGVSGDPSGNKMYTIKEQEMQVNPDWGSHIEINEYPSAGSAAHPYNGKGNFTAASRTLVQKLQNALIPFLDPLRSAEEVVDAYNEEQFNTETKTSIGFNGLYHVFNRHQVTHQTKFTIDTIPDETAWSKIESGIQTTLMSQMGYEWNVRFINSIVTNWSQSQDETSGSLFNKLDQMNGEELKSMNIARVSKQEIRNPALKQTVESSNDDRDHAYVANFPMEIKGEKKITNGTQRRTAHRR